MMAWKFILWLCNLHHLILCLIFSTTDLAAIRNKQVLMVVLDIFLLFDYHRNENLKTQACHLPLSTTLYSEESILYNSFCNCNYHPNGQLQWQLVSQNTYFNRHIFHNQPQVIIWLIKMPVIKMDCWHPFPIVEEISTTFKLKDMAKL